MKTWKENNLLKKIRESSSSVSGTVWKFVTNDSRAIAWKIDMWKSRGSKTNSDDASIVVSLENIKDIIDSKTRSIYAWAYEEYAYFSSKEAAEEFAAKVFPEIEGEVSSVSTKATYYPLITDCGPILASERSLNNKFSRYPVYENNELIDCIDIDSKERYAVVLTIILRSFSAYSYKTQPSRYSDMYFESSYNDFKDIVRRIEAGKELGLIHSVEQKYANNVYQKRNPVKAAMFCALLHHPEDVEKFEKGSREAFNLTVKYLKDGTLTLDAFADGRFANVDPNLIGSFIIRN